MQFEKVCHTSKCVTPLPHIHNNMAMRILLTVSLIPILGAFIFTESLADPQWDAVDTLKEKGHYVPALEKSNSGF